MNLRPRYGRRTRPCAVSWRTTRFTSSMGTAKAMPSIPIAFMVLTPITRPCTSRSGPPELPEFMDASVWIYAVVFRAPSESCKPSSERVRSMADTMPKETELVSPSGAPSATTNSPGRRSDDEPSSAAGSAAWWFTRTTAMSEMASECSTTPRSRVTPSERVTVTVPPRAAASRTTWQLVRTRPDGSTTNPDPEAPCIAARRPLPAGCTDMLTSAGATRAAASAMKEELSGIAARDSALWQPATANAVPEVDVATAAATAVAAPARRAPTAERVRRNFVACKSLAAFM
mmetsp:Transcript_49226/g.162990  ORF Transcript_49226/g.162990 Transcript_49226/m.162990 type:complete len:288 (-) Transcript_49226:98-961(-)